LAIVDDGSDEIARRQLELGDLAGYEDEIMNRTVNAGGSAASWYVSSRTLDDTGRVRLAFLVPAELMTVGATFQLIALSIGGLLLLGLSAIIITRVSRGFTTPLERLSESARRVSAGDLSMTVEAPRGHEMAPFVDIYNGMLARLRELISNRSRLSRQAGMADLAAGVLHNVGNALTGVRTGVDLAQETLERMPIEHTRRLSQLLDGAKDDPARFFCEGGRGQRVPAFVRELASSLERSQRELRTELERASTAAEHASAAVRAQQRHARPIELVERCVVRDVVDDALNIAGVERRAEAITVHREYVDIEAWVDRHRLIQIVVNLATNACEAIEATGRGHGRLDVTVGYDPRRGVTVRLSDDGVGVAPKDRDRIFSMGHTTKEDGHGLGLHGSANLAAEMGGSLRMETPANGTGATFELRFPIRMPSRSPLELGRFVASRAG
jgi:signal transduction histidine kinase